MFNSESDDQIDITRSTIDTNHALSSAVGGGILHVSGVLTVVNSTISGNTTEDDGGGIFSAAGPDDDVFLVNVTVANNGANGTGGNLRNLSGTLVLTNTIVANDTAGGDCVGTITSNGNNIDTDNSCQLVGVNDQPSASPQLGPLQDNGGPTFTRALQAGSNAFDAGNNAVCALTPVVGVGVGQVDQRGTARPQSASCDIGAYEGGDVVLTKTDGSLTAVPGAVVIYTITVASGESVEATVADTFPAVLTNVQWTCAPAGGATCAAGPVNGNINDAVVLPAGSSATYTVTGTVLASALGTLDNTATVTVTSPAGFGDPNPSNNTATDSDVLTPSADLTMGKTAGANPVVIGETFAYTLTVTNAGPSDAAGVVVTDTLPPGATLVSTVPGSPTCTVAGALVTCTLGALAAGANGVVTVTVTTNPGSLGTATNTAWVSTATSDPKAGNDSAAVMVTVNQAPTQTALTVVNARPIADPIGVVIGTNVTTTFTVGVPAPGSGTPTGTVTITDGVDSLQVAVEAGGASLTLNTLGTRTLTATYGGDTNFLSSTSPGVPHDVTCPTISVGPSALPTSTTTTVFATTSLSATGGQAPYTFTLGGVLPAGLTFSGGVLAGEPKQLGSFPVTATATDANGCTGASAYTIEVTQGVLTYRTSEGAFGGVVDSFLLIFNPTGTPADVTLAFQTEAGTRAATTLSVPPTTRVTLPIGAVAGPLLSRTGAVSSLPPPAPTAVGSTVTSTKGVPLVVEESTYFSAPGTPAFTDGLRIPAGQASTTWYIAEASEKLVDLGAGPVDFFDTFLLLANDTGTPTTAIVTFLPEPPQLALVQTYALPAHTRLTIPTATVNGGSLVNTSFGMVVTAGVPIAAARAQYFGSPGYRGAHGSAGVPTPSTTWLFAEGSTNNGFDTYFTAANPHAEAATVTFTYQRLAGGTTTQALVVPPQSRAQVYVNTSVGANADFYTRVSSTHPVAIERLMYKPGPQPGTWDFAHSSPGVTAAGLKWGFAEGAVGLGPDFQTFVLMANPSPTTAAQVTATYFREDGTTVAKTYTVPPTSRITVWVNLEVPELADTGFSITLESTNGVPFVADQSMYWNGVTGGTTSTAIAIP